MNSLFPKIFMMTFLGGIIAIASSCGGGDDDDDDDSSASTLTLSVSDAPIDDATSVVVEFTGIELKPEDGDAFENIFTAPRQIDLLSLQGGESETLLDEVEVPAGAYNFVRLMVNAGRTASDSYVDLEDGSRHALFIPSGDQRGLMLIGGFDVPEGGNADFVIDFDLRKSVHNPQGQDGVYILRPVLRLIDRTEAGEITGTVSNSLAAATDDCTPAVYVYAGQNAVTSDEGSANPPLTTALVQLGSNGSYEYTAAFLPAGSYTVAFTCDAAADDPEASDQITFQQTSNVTVGAEEEITLNFDSP
jgi:hypothetical protein